MSKNENAAEAGQKAYYVTTPIYYVNDYPHIGHIYTTIVVDTLARWHRLRGERVYFLTGTDEHGQKIEKAAAKMGVEPIALADQVVERYHGWWRLLGMSNDDFIRTTEKRHFAGVVEIIRRLKEQGDLYSSHHEGLYCVGCETFYTDKELLPGNRCKVHETVCEARSEENIFFRLSKYQQALLDHYEAHPEFIQPETRRNEVQQFVASGLRDLSVSRTNVAWGIPFPGHDDHTVYVWLDALVNYITALGFGGENEALYEELWQGGGQRVHVVGKDILRFHAVYWPAFLLSAGIPLPTTIWAHGWWLRDGQKMSKSVGNVVRPDHLVEKFGADPLRYFVLREMVFGQDGVFSDEAFVDRYNSDLANDLGNTLSRVVTVSRKAFGEHLPPRRGDALRQQAELAVAEYRASMDAYAFQDALRSLWRLLQETNQYLVANEPWKKLADPANLDQVSEVLWTSAEALRIIATGLLPILPVQAPLVLAALKASVPTTAAGLDWGQLPTGLPLPAVEPLFPRVDKKLYLAEIAATRGGTPPEETSAQDKKKEKVMATKKTAAPDPDSNPEATAAAGAAEAAAAPAAEEKQPITIDQFMAVELKVALVKAAERVPKSDKLLRLTVEIGEPETRTIVAGIGKQYEPDELIGKQVVVVANLAPAKLMGIDSNGMVLAASPSGLPVLLRPLEEVPPGTRVR